VCFSDIGWIQMSSVPVQDKTDKVKAQNKDEQSKGAEDAEES